jgi:predicted TIM-barrel fold metal-dependent hydrolase
MIVDCHTHWGTVWEDRDRDDPTRWLETLDRHGITKAVIFGHYNLIRCDRCQMDNNRLAQLAARVPERLIPFGTVWPQMGAEAVAETRRCFLELGLRGLKFHPWLQGFSTADPVFGEVCALAGELGRPVLLHDGTPCYSLPEQIAGLARRFPQTRFILGHTGLLWHWRSALEALRQPNVWACLCGPHARGLEILCREAPADRLLWGSDYGFGFADAIEYRLALVREAQIAPALRNRILGENPRRLLEEIAT